MVSKISRWDILHQIQYHLMFYFSIWVGFGSSKSRTTRMMPSSMKSCTVCLTVLTNVFRKGISFFLWKTVYFCSDWLSRCCILAVTFQDPCNPTPRWHWTGRWNHQHGKVFFSSFDTIVSFLMSLTALLPFRSNSIQLQRRLVSQDVVLLERSPKSKKVAPKIKIKKEKKRVHWPSKTSNLWNIHMYFVKSISKEISLDGDLLYLEFIHLFFP